jgi:hypothetical protein
MKCVRLGALIVVVGLFLSLSPSMISAATFSLSPSSGTWNRGCSYTVKVDMDSLTAAVDGADAILSYDPYKVTTSLTMITPGKLFSDYPGTTVDDKAGNIRISAINASGTAAPKKGTFATLTFKVKSDASLGVTSVALDFDSKNPTKTSDSNILEAKTAKDLLTKVTSGNFTVGTGSCESQAVLGETKTSTVTPSPKAQPKVLGESTEAQGATSEVEETTELPSSGISTPTIVVGVIGVLLIMAGGLGLLFL